MIWLALLGLPAMGYIISGVVGSLFAGIFVNFFLGAVIKIIVIAFAILIGLRLIRDKNITKQKAVVGALLIFGLLATPFIINTGIFRGMGIASFTPIVPVEGVNVAGGLLTGGEVGGVQDIGMFISLGLVFFLSYTNEGHKRLKQMGFNFKRR